MTERRKRLEARYAAAKQRVKEAEKRIQRVSEKRLTELMKLSERQRFDQLEDDRLTKADRAKLRQSIAVSLQTPTTQALLWGGRWRVRRLVSWLRRRLSTTIAATIIVVPLAIMTNTARRNTGEVIILPKPITLDWRLPSGGTQQRLIGAGYRLVIVPQSGALSLARHWILGQGYATAPVNIERRL